MKAAAASLGFKQVPLEVAVAANGMTALYFPPNISAGDLIHRLLRKGIVDVGGLHVDIKGEHH
jgi:alanine-glyoxylate transaminase / serine-glyoxylate transaminase / serine-pyruvate transaminase